MEYRFDAHCHIFTLKYVLKEIKSLVHDIVKRTYPWQEPVTGLQKQLKAKHAGPSLSDVKELLRQLFQIIHAAGGSEEENLDFLQKEAKKAYPDASLKIIPLMMDIFYMLAYPLKAGEDVVAQPNLKSAMLINEDEFDSSWHEILDDFSTFLEEKKGDDKFSKAKKLIDDAVFLIEEERVSSRHLKSLSLKKSKPGYSDSFSFYKTDGYCYHMDNLMDLVKNRKGELYPMIAIDPRRPGMMNDLSSGKFFEGDEKFYGVKLYPRMGVHPLSKPMFKVYDYCSNNNLPITFHCGKSGFPPGTDWKYAEYGYPGNFEKVVNDYPNLKIDFAHLGSSDPSYEWADKVVEMVNKYDNVYTDLSCYTDLEQLKYIKATYWDTNEKLRSRLMFGTDFDVMYFTDRVTMEIYYENFKSAFSTEEMNVIMHDIPYRFMNL